MKTYNTEDLLYLIPKESVKQCYVEDSPGYNACWDYHITPKGRHFLACCAEGAFPEFVRLYEYYPDANTLELKFKLDEKIVVYPRAIRPSKFHTSMNTMPDGRIIMTTHTTASAPSHACWMPEAYYSHMWEGYYGSNVIIYDPESGKVEDLGIPVPRESIYGAMYIEEEDALFFITMFRGHAYKMDLKSRKVTDFGQCTEAGTYLLHKGPDGKIYFSSRMGHIFRYDSKIGHPEFLGIQAPIDKTLAKQGRNCINYAANGPDGLIYFCTHPNTAIYSLNPESLEIKEVCKARIPEILSIPHASCLVFGLQFDKDGVLWFTATSGVGHTPLRLCSIDVKDPHAKLMDWGGIGTEARANFCIEGLYLKDNVLYLPDANGPYSPGVCAIDLSLLKKNHGKEKLMTQDPQCFHLNTVTRLEQFYHGKTALTAENLITEDDKSGIVQGEYNKNNPYRFKYGNNIYCTKLWHTYGPSESSVNKVSFDKEGNILAYIGTKERIEVKINKGKITSSRKVDLPICETKEEISEKFKNYKLPAHPGRQFLAKANAYGILNDGTYIVGTLDGGVALIKDDVVFSLGMVCNDGPVHDIAVSPDGELAIGVCGDPDSLGMVFSFTKKNGLNLEGMLTYGTDINGEECSATNTRPYTVSFSPDGKKLAIGTMDELGSVYEYEI